MSLGTLVERSVSILGYPPVTHGLLNRYADAVDLDIAPSSQIAAGCLLRGDVTLEAHTRLSRGCVLGGDVTVKKRTNLEPNCDLVGNVEIGKYCAIARESTFQQTNHRTAQPSMQIRFYDDVLDSELPPTTEGPITVGNDVWIGTGTTFLSGVTVGDGAIVGAGSVVTSDVEPYAVVAGVPAERINWRFPEDVREALRSIEWWEWNEETMRANREFFERELHALEDIPQSIVERHGTRDIEPPPSSTPE